MNNHVVEECFRDEIENRLAYWDEVDYELLTCTMIEPKTLTIGETDHYSHDAKFLLIFKSHSFIFSRKD